MPVFSHFNISETAVCRKPGILQSVSVDSVFYGVTLLSCGLCFVNVGVTFLSE